MNYERVGVASNFSPTFAAVLAEAAHFAGRHGASLEIVHAAEYDAGKENRFRKALARPAEIRWVQGDTPAQAIIGAAERFDYQLLIAGALYRENAERPFTSSVARDLLSRASCDVLLLPHPAEQPQPIHSVVFALEPGRDESGFLQAAIAALQPRRVTIVAVETPFAAAIAASRGESLQNLDEWLEKIALSIDSDALEIDARVVTSNTGYALCDVVEGLAADLLVVRSRAGHGSLPAHMSWLYQVIPTRLLLVRSATPSTAPAAGSPPFPMP